MNSMRELLERTLNVLTGEGVPGAYIKSLVSDIESELAKPEPEPDYYVVVDEYGNPVYAATFKQACHDHINEAIDNDHIYDSVEVSKWIVKGTYTHPLLQQEPEPMLLVNVWRDGNLPCFNIEWLSFPTDWEVGSSETYKIVYSVEVGSITEKSLPLYTHTLAQKNLMTDNEILSLAKGNNYPSCNQKIVAFARAIERKVKGDSNG